MKRTLSLLIAFLAALSCLFLSGCARRTTPVKDLSYEIVDNTVVIKGYLGDDKQVVIPETIEGVKVVTIGENAFADSEVESVILPDSIMEIGDDAFQDCKNLKTVQLPEKLKTIGMGAFAECSNLTEVKLPEKLKTIGWAAFAGCSNLTEVTIPENVTSLEYFAFANCEKLRSVTMSDELYQQLQLGNSILADIFSGCPDDLLVNGQPVPKNLSFRF